MTYGLSTHIVNAYIFITYWNRIVFGWCNTYLLYIFLICFIYCIKRIRFTFLSVISLPCKLWYLSFSSFVLDVKIILKLKVKDIDLILPCVLLFLCKLATKTHFLNIFNHFLKLLLKDVKNLT